MVANVETMAYAGQVPWHGLGNQVSEAITTDDMLDAAGLNWRVQKKPMFFNDAEMNNKPVDDYYALVRDTDNKSLGVCGKDYTPAQNKSTLDFFKKWCTAGHMSLETAGSLDGGRQVWALAKIKDSFSLFKEDPVQGYLLLNSPHVWGKSLIIKFTPIRVVCQNTLMMAMRDSSGQSFRMPHRYEFGTEMMKTAEEALGISIDMMAAFKKQAEVLAKTKCDAQAYYRYLTKLFAPADFKQLAEEDTLSIADLNRNAYQVATYLNTQPGHTLKSSSGTWWGALNSLTYWVDHKSGRERDTALTAAWFGTKAKLKESALELAVSAANDPKILMTA
jgi:phage/plasmid-like protein (TIGR03299 family)